jgi:hypothetical protein
MAATAAAHNCPARAVTTVNRPLPVRSSAAETRLPFPVDDPRMGHRRTWPRRSPPDRSPRRRAEDCHGRETSSTTTATGGPCSATQSMSSTTATSRPAGRCTAMSPRSCSPGAPTAPPVQWHDRRRRGRDPQALARRRDHAGVDQADRSETRAVMAGITETGPTFARPSMPAVQGDRAGSVGQEGSPASQACLSVSSDHYKLPTAPFLREQRRPGGQLRHLGHIHPRRRSRSRPSLT